MRAFTAVLGAAGAVGGTWLSAASARSWLSAASARSRPAAGWWADGWGSGGWRSVVLLWGIAGVCLLLLRWDAFGGRDPGRWHRGSVGEVLTAFHLSRLSGRGWVLRHDLRIPGSRANIDHVVIGRTGIWVVDTKTTRAPIRAGWRNVRFGDRRLDVASLRWESETLSDRLEAELGWSVAGVVRPVVAVHGDGMRRRGGRVGRVPVLPGDRLAGRIRRGRRRLRRAEIAEVADALGRAFPTPSSAPTGRRRRAESR